MKNLLKNLWERIREFFGGTRFVCDTCLYNYRNACMRPERPNATRCPDYKRK